MAKKISEYKYERANVEAARKFIGDAIAEIKNATDAKTLVAVRERVNRYVADFSTIVYLATIRHTLNVNDPFYAGEQNYYDESLPALSATAAEFNKAIAQSPYFDGFKALVNPRIVDKMLAGLRVMDDRIIEDCVEENKLVTQYDELMANVTYPWQGKNVTLSEMHGHCKNPDRSVRKAAFAVIGETLDGISEKLDGIYDKLVKVRTRMAKKMGFDNYVEMGDLRMEHVGFGRKEVAVFRESVLRDVVPVLSELKAELAQKLGIDRVHIYDNDVYVAGGNIDPVGSAKDMFAAAQEMYDDMDDKLGAFFKEMCDADAIDYIAREGKQGGGYAEMLYSYGQPFIFANFNGTMDDVGVLTHEFGHAYAFKRAYVNDIDYDIFIGGMEIAETHSMSMEALCNKYNDKFYGNRAREATYQQIFDALNFLPYGVIVDYFQQRVYENPDMTPAERKALWAELEKEYRPYVDMSDVAFYKNGGRWQYQKHIYEVPFYYIDYCLSTCLALQFGEKADANFKGALAEYLRLVEAGGTKDITTLAHEAGLKSPFDAGALSGLCKAVEKHIERLGKK